MSDAALPGGGTVHLLKLSVGSESLQSMRRRWLERTKLTRDGVPYVTHTTRNMPRRRLEVLNGGSLYWIIKGVICIRTPILDLEPVENEKGERRCRIVLDARGIDTEPWPHRPMQGWRYLEVADAPPDRTRLGDGSDPLPVEMATELRALGLI